jgi:hypothetical protein
VVPEVATVRNELGDLFNVSEKNPVTVCLILTEDTKLEAEVLFFDDPVLQSHVAN